MTVLSERQRGWLRHDVLDQACDSHGCPMWGKTNPVTGDYCTFCPECGAERIEADFQNKVQSDLRAIERYQKFELLERESIISPELKTASFDTFKVATAAETEGLRFAQAMTRHYYNGGTGNVVLSGRPGQGKSHLALGMLRTLNETYGKKEQYRSAVFMPVARLFSLIKDTFKTGEGLTEARAIRLLSECDFLVLDDLGKESSYGHELKRANDWTQSVLFNILENRERTIITTNFTAEDLSYIYDPALYDRMVKGGVNMKFRFDDTIASKR